MKTSPAPAATVTSKKSPRFSLLIAAAGAALLSACASTGTPPQAALAPVIDERAELALAMLDDVDAELSDMRDREAYPDLLDRLATPSSLLEAQLQEGWVLDQLQAGEASVVTIEPILDRYAAENRQDDLYFWFMYGALTLFVDAARCADATAPFAQVEYWKAATDHAARAFEALPPAQQAGVVAAALDLEATTRDKRRADRWMCAEGDDYWREYFTRYPERAVAGQGLPPRDLTIEIRAKTNDAWYIERDRIRDIFRRGLVVRSLGAIGLAAQES